MNKFWLNEKTLVFSSIILLLLFLGLVALMGAWMGALLPGVEPTSCYPGECLQPEIEIDEAKLKKRIVYLDEILANLPLETREDGSPITTYDIHIEKGRIYSELND